MNRLRYWIYHLLARWSWIGCLLLIPSLTWGAQTDSYVNFTGTASTGQSAYVLDNASFEIASSTNQYMAIGVRYQRNSTSIATWESVFGKNTPNSYGIWFVLGTGEPELVINNGIGDIDTQGGPSSNFSTATNVIQSIVGTAGPGNAGLTTWVNGNFHKATTPGLVIADTAASLVLGSDHAGTYSANIKVFQAFIAFADIPIISHTDTGVTLWHQQPGQYPLPFTSAVSRYYLWDGKGMRGLPASKIYQSGVSTGMVPGQFDMSFNQPSTKADYKIWTPANLWDLAQGIWSRWKTGKVP